MSGTKLTQPVFALVFVFVSCFLFFCFFFLFFCFFVFLFFCFFVFYVFPLKRRLGNLGGYEISW